MPDEFAREDKQPEDRSFRTNDQLKPKPPENAPPQPGLSPLGTVGTHPRLSQEALRHNMKVYRKLAADRQREESLRGRGGLRQDFDRER